MVSKNLRSSLVLVSNQLQDPVQRANTASKVIVEDISKAMDNFYEAQFNRLDQQDQQFAERFPKPNPEEPKTPVEKEENKTMMVCLGTFMNDVFVPDPKDEFELVENVKEKIYRDIYGPNPKAGVKPAIVGEAPKGDIPNRDENKKNEGETRDTEKDTESDEDDVIEIDVSGIVNMDRDG